MKILSILLLALLSMPCHAEEGGADAAFALATSTLEQISQVDLRQNPCALRKSASELLPAAEAILKAAPEATKAKASETINLFWQSRLKLRSRLSTETSPDCILVARLMNQDIRLIEENILAIGVHQLGNKEKQTAVEFEGSEPTFLWNPEYPKMVFKSGDLIISHQNDFISAGLAVGAYGGAFDHLGIIYVDPADNIAYMVDTTGKKGGVGIRPLLEHFNHTHVRQQLYRYKDAELATKAAEIMYKRAKAVLDQKREIPYDYKFDLNDDGVAMFCSEVAYDGFRRASNGKVLLPQFPASYMPGALEISRRLRAKNPGAFAPSDLEIDNHFDLVADWRDPASVLQTHWNDNVLHDMYEWIEHHHYRIFSSVDSGIVKYVADPIRRIPGIGDLSLGELFPVDIPPEFLETFYLMTKVSGAIAKSARHGHADIWLESDMHARLEEVRIQELQAAQRHKKTRFHKNFRPSEGSDIP